MEHEFRRDERGGYCPCGWRASMVDEVPTYQEHLPAEDPS